MVTLTFLGSLACLTPSSALPRVKSVLMEANGNVATDLRQAPFG